MPKKEIKKGKFWLEKDEKERRGMGGGQKKVHKNTKIGLPKGKERKGVGVKRRRGLVIFFYDDLFCSSEFLYTVIPLFVSAIQ